MSEVTSIFNPGNVEAAPAKANSEIYKVNYKEGKGNIYNAVIRFIPWVTDPSKLYFEKQVSYVKKPMTSQGIYVDDPRSIGEFSPVSDMFFKFYNTKNDAFIKYAREHLSSKQQYASLVQIIKDEQHPELQGQIKVFIYGSKVWQKIYDEQHPPVGVGVNPFHPIDGKFFYIHCCEKSGFNNYDQCKFFDNNGNNGMYIAVGDRMEQVTANTDQNAVVEYLRVNSPDLSKYGYQPWTQEQAKFVEEVLQMSAAYLNTGTLPSNTAVVNGAANMQPVAQPTFPGIQQPQGMTQGMPQAMPQVMPQTQPMMPQMPQMNMQSTPAPSAMSGFNIGGMPAAAPAAAAPGLNPSLNPGVGMVTEPGINGINLPPTVGNDPQPAAAPAMGSIGGNIDDILSNI